ncbi:MAG: hypothetical protein IT178_15085 [Acidobacteria bacterium]|nr:hypothetical protein [Acidobacteriota bacterium]
MSMMRPSIRLAALAAVMTALIAGLAPSAGRAARPTRDRDRQARVARVLQRADTDWLTHDADIADHGAPTATDQQGLSGTSGAGHAAAIIPAVVTVLSAPTAEAFVPVHYRPPVLAGLIRSALADRAPPVSL